MRCDADCTVRRAHHHESEQRQLERPSISILGGNVSKPITGETTYTLSCLTQNGTTLTKSTTVASSPPSKTSDPPLERAGRALPLSANGSTEPHATDVAFELGA